MTVAAAGVERQHGPPRRPGRRALNEETQPDRDLVADFDGRRLLKKGVLAAAAIVLTIGGLGLIFRQPILDASGAFVEVLGGPGIALGFFIPDAFAFPLPHEAFSTLGLFGGMPFWIVVAWASVGSLAGGSVGWVIGVRLSHTRWFRRIMAGRGAEANQLVGRYGKIAVAIGAVSPLPYSVCCWAAGALGMRFRPFFLVSLLRIPRVAFYLWLVQIGFLTVAT